MKHYLLKKILKNKEIILYIFFGGLTTLVNYGCYFTNTKVLKINYLYSNIIAWLISVLFAFLVNKFLVFNTKKNKNLFKELMFFFSVRLFSGFLETILLFIFVDLLKFGDGLIKILSSVIVIILNYYFSKLYIFN